MTLFAILLDTCGLSHREAAEYLEVRLDTVKSWSAKRRGAPPGALAELARLAEKIESAAADGFADIQNLVTRYPPTDPIELGLASDDHEAQSIGWPCVGAQRACLGRVAAAAIAAGLTVEIVPRGATVASAAATDVHDALKKGEK